MTANEIIQKLREVIPNDTLELWYELPRDIDSMVAHDFIRDVLKDGMIRVYNEIENTIHPAESAQEFSVMLDYQKLITQGLGMIEIYLSEYRQS